MSSSTAAAVSGRRQPFFCYQCDGEVTLTSPSNSEDLVCPVCGGGFLEEITSDSSPPPNPNPNPNFNLPPPPFSFLDAFPSAFPDLNTLPNHPFSRRGGGGGGSIVFRSTGMPGEFGGFEENVFDPIAFLQNHLQNLRAEGASIEFVIGNQGGGGFDSGFGIGSGVNLGDYFLGPGLEQLIQQLAENDPNRYGTPPASKKEVEGLPSVKVTEELAKSDSSQCAVCLNEFELGSEVKQMPCKHVFHGECILPWLELHNSCPVCRHELPTDDADYENRVVRNQGLGAGGSSGGVSGAVGGGEEQAGSPRPSAVQRRFSISLPWPFSSFLAPDGADGGRPEHGGGSGVSGGGDRASGSRDQSGGQGGSQPRQESLD
ncbi:hypothetical protein Droror1_Dr00019714 [Drosera rotundifolia]